MPEPYVPPKVPSSADVTDLAELEVKTRHYDLTEIRQLRIQGGLEPKTAPLRATASTHQVGELAAEPPTRLETTPEDPNRLLVPHERVSVQRPNIECRSPFEFRRIFYFTLPALAVTAGALLFWPAPAELKPRQNPVTATSPPPVDEAATEPRPHAAPPLAAVAQPAHETTLPHPTLRSAVEPQAIQTPRQAAVFLLDGRRSEALQAYAEIARQPGVAPVFRVIATQLKTQEASR